MKWFNNLGLGTKLRFILLLFSFGLILFGLLSYYTIEDLRINGITYKKIVQGKDLVADILPPPDYIVETNLVCYQLLSENDENKIKNLIEKSQQLKRDYFDRHEFWVKDLDESEMKKHMVENSFYPAEKFFQLRDEQFIPLILNKKRLDAEKLLLNEMKAAYEEHRGYIDKVVTIANNNNADIEKEASSLIKSRYAILLSIGVGLLISIFLIVSAIFKRIKSAITKVMSTIQELSKGHVHVRATVNSHDEIGVIANTLNGLAFNLDSFSKLMYRISDGDFSVQSNSADKDDELAPALNSIVESLRNLIEETSKLTKAGLEGRLQTRGDIGKFKGSYKKIIQGINSTLDAVIEPIHEASYVLGKMSQGDLTARMEKTYGGDFQKIKGNINNLGITMSNAIGEVYSAVDAATLASNNISSSSEEMAAGSFEQSSRINDIVNSIKQISQTIIDTNKNSITAAKAAKNSGNYAQEGEKVVNESIEGMNKIVDVVSKSTNTIKKLGKSSDQIAEITKVIDEIAEQTNLLALNAAIEAARAGELGRGFAVVADEVRKLAERTTKATKEIETVIKLILTEMTEAVTSMEAGELEVLKGKELSSKTGHSLNKIKNGTQEVIKIATTVADTSEKQTTEVEQIASNIEGVNQVSNETSKGIHEIAKASNDLHQLTLNLQSLVSRFKISTGDEKKEILTVFTN